MNLLTKQKDTDLENKFIAAEGKGQSGSLWWSCAHSIFKMDNQQNLLYSTWNSAQCYVAAWMGVGVGGE